jgi:hypothetical protein
MYASYHCSKHLTISGVKKYYRNMQVIDLKISQGILGINQAENDARTSIKFQVRNNCHWAFF